MKATQTVATRKKIAKSKAQAPTTDLFCKVIKSTLKVDVVMEFRFHPVRRWRFDYCIPSHLIAIEVEGGVWTQGRHTRPKGFLGDVEKYNTATALGYRVFRVTPDKLLKTETFDLVASAINQVKAV